MNPYAINQMDSLSLKFAAPGNPYAGDHGGLAPFFESLEAHAHELIPAHVDGLRPRKYSRKAIQQAMEETLREGFRAPHFTLTRHDSPCASFDVFIHSVPSPGQFTVLASVLPFSFFEEPLRATERSRYLIDLVRAWGSSYPASYAFIHSEADRQLAGDPNYGRDDETRRKNRYDCVYAIFWLNVLGKALVDSIGRARVLSTPAHLVEELPSGAILILTRPTVADFASEEGRQAQARALVHLRPDLDFDTVLRELRARSAALAPVEPRFDPDLAGLLHKVLDHSPISERQRKIAELNAFRPAEVDEWLPAHAAPRSDVADPEKAIAEYETLGEQLVALTHTDVPSVFDETPEALMDVDYWVWYGNYPKRYKRSVVDEILLPSAGGYLGRLLVKRLGGRWVPRRNIEEAQVVVGDRAWLPFLRARRYVQSEQSVLASSLTKLYREAERHRRGAPSA